MHDAYGHGSIFLWRRYNPLSSSGFVDDMFSGQGADGPEITRVKSDIYDCIVAGLRCVLTYYMSVEFRAQKSRASDILTTD